MLHRFIVVSILIAIITAGCMPSREAETPEPSATAIVALPTLENQFTPTATITRTDTPPPTIAPSPTDTVVPIPEFPTLTPTVAPENTITPTPAPFIEGRVAEDRGGLRMRQLPDTSSNVLLNLDANTELEIQGRSADNNWVLVEIPEGFTGWVWRDYINVFGNISVIAIIENPEPEPFFAVSPPPEAPVITGNITGGARNIYLQGQQKGNRRNMFTTVGDSITNTAYFLHHFAYNYNLQNYGYLLPALQFFSAEIARDSNAFDNFSRAAREYWTSFEILNPEYRDVAICNTNETPLECELRIVRPAIALIMIGTNDIGQGTSTGVYEQNLRQIIEITINMGVIPVVSTLPPRFDADGQVAAYNQVIRRLTQSYDIPLWDYWSELQKLPDKGISDDGVHPSVPPGGAPATVDFTPENLQYGTTLRNLMALQILDSLWRNVMY